MLELLRRGGGCSALGKAPHHAALAFPPGRPNGEYRLTGWQGAGLGDANMKAHLRMCACGESEESGPPFFAKSYSVCSSGCPRVHISNVLYFMVMMKEVLCVFLSSSINNRTGLACFACVFRWGKIYKCW